MVIFPICNFNSSYTTFFSVHLVNQCVCLRCFRFSSSTSVNKHISGTGAFRLSVRSSASLMRVHPALMHAKFLFNDKRYVQWTSDWCKSRRYFVQSWQKSNTCTQPRARAHSVLRVCDHWAFLVFLCHKYAQASFFLITGSEHDETISAGVYHKCYQRRLRGACAFVQSRRVTQSFGVDEESRHLRTPTN